VVAPIVIPLVIIALAIPLIAGWAPPNFWYGVRTPKTMSSPRIWYPANRRAGIYLLIASSVTLLAMLALRGTEWSPRDSPQAMLTVAPGPILAALIGSLIYLRKL
jgi:uncharacterized membrane protein